MISKKTCYWSNRSRIQTEEKRQNDIELIPRSDDGKYYLNILEKVLATQIDGNILAIMPENIFGYRPNKSTSQALLWLMKPKNLTTPC